MEFDEKAIQILELTQATIQRALIELIHNEDWGDPRAYNITITRKGEKLGTEYNVVPSPKSAVPPMLLQDYQERKIDLNKRFEGSNLFDASERNESLDGDAFPTNMKDACTVSREDTGDINPNEVRFKSTKKTPASEEAGVLGCAISRPRGHFYQRGTTKRVPYR